MGGGGVAGTGRGEGGEGGAVAEGRVLQLQWGDGGGPFKGQAVGGQTQIGGFSIVFFVKFVSRG